MIKIGKKLQSNKTAFGSHLFYWEEKIMKEQMLVNCVQAVRLEVLSVLNILGRCPKFCCIRPSARNTAFPNYLIYGMSRFRTINCQG